MGAILAVLVVLWLLGIIHLPGFSIPNLSLFQVNGHPITLLNIFVFLIILWAIGLLGSPLREIAVVVLILWILTVLGFIAIAGFSNILVLAIIIGLALSFLKKGHHH